jgi:hypothetical protein
MSFDIGELVGSVRIDDAQAQRALSQLPGKAKAAGSQTEAAMKGVTKSTDDIGKGADRAGTAFTGMGAKFKVALGAIAGFAAGGALVSFLSDSVTAASNLNETINKTDTIFGSSSASVKQWGESAATSLGLSKGAALEAASNFGNMFTQLGFTGEAAADLSTQVVQMSADLGSFNNLPTADVAERISSAFRGEYDSLQLLIPGITAARVEQEAMAASGKNTAKELTAQEKAMAVLAIVSQDGAKAMGDFARTSDGFANQQKIMAARLDDTKAAIGARLMPVIQQLMDIFQSVGIPAIEAFGSALGVLATVIAPIAKVIATIPGPVLAMAAAFATIQAFGGLGAIMSKLGSAVGALARPFADSSKGAVTFGSALGGLAKVGAGLGAAFLVSEVFSAWQQNAEHNARATAVWTGRVEELASALGDTNGVWDESVQAIQDAQLVQSGFFKTMVENGVDGGVALRALKGDTDALALAQEHMRGVAGLPPGFVELLGEYGKKTAETAGKARDLAKAQQEATDSAKRLGTVGSEVGAGMANLTGTAGQVGSALAGAFDLAADAAGKFSSKLKLDEFKRQLDGITTPTQDIENALSEVGAAADEAADRVEYFGIKLNELNGINITAEQAQKILNDQVREVGEAFKEATEATEGNVEGLIAQSGAIDTAAEAGSNLFDAVQNYRGAYDDATQAAYDNAIANGDVAGAVAAAQGAATNARQSFLDAASALGINGDEAIALADHYGILDGQKISDKNFKVTAEEKQAREALENVIGTGIKDKSFHINTDPNPALGSIGRVVGTGIPNKPFAINTDPGPALFSIGRIVGTGIPNKNFAVTASDLASSVLGSIIGRGIPNKSFVISASDAASGLINSIIGRSIPNKSFNVVANLVGSGAAQVLGGATGGQVGRLQGLPGYAVGGRLPGTPPTDSRLDNLLGFANGSLFGLRSREWVVDEKTADYYGDRYFRDLALRRLPKQGYAEGGRLAGPAAPVTNVAVGAPVVDVRNYIDSDELIRRTEVYVDGKLQRVADRVTTARGQAR